MLESAKEVRERCMAACQDGANMNGIGPSALSCMFKMCVNFPKYA